MKKYLRNILYSLILLTAAVPTHAQEWPVAGNAARPASRWWWPGSAVNSSNLTELIRTYANAGLGGLEITPIYGVQGNDANEIPYLSDSWMKMLAHTESEAEKNGMYIDMNTGTGWPFGGPETDLRNAAKMALFSRYNINGGQTVTMDISPQKSRNADSAVLCKVMAYQGSRVKDITGKVSGNTLRWKAPSGKWEIVALHIGHTLQKVKRAAPGGNGYVMDHFDAESVNNYLRKFDRAFSTSKVAWPHTLFNDSYEVYKADWTPSLLDEFARRRGYRLENYFREFLSDDRNSTAARVVSDYRETLSDLLLENFTVQWTRWAHSHGCMTRNQAHGSPASLIDIYAATDIPEAESFGISNFNIRGLRKDSLTKKNYSDISMLKYASSAAHISGKKLCSSETLTWLTEHFRTSLSQCKPDIDLMFVAGVNNIFFHGTCYSPREARWPGWKFYASVDMSPTNTIWRDAPYMFGYITRCQSFLQWGQPDNDVLVYIPLYDIWHNQPGRLLQFDIHKMSERAPELISNVVSMNNCGYGIDYISDRFVMSLQCDSGLLRTSGGSRYRAIVVPAADLVPAGVMRKLISLANDGATLVFLHKYPSDVPGLGHLSARRREMAKALHRLPAAVFSRSESARLGKGLVVTGSEARSTLALCGFNAETGMAAAGLSFIRRANSKGFHYFISCLQDKGVDGWVRLGKGAAQAYLFNPMNGDVGAARLRQKDGATEVYLQLESGESVILQTLNEKSQGDVNRWKYICGKGNGVCLDSGWTLRFKSSVPAIEGTHTIDSLRSWTDLNIEGCKVNRGTGCYATEFQMPDTSADDWILELGDVRESARITVNGTYAGCAWSVPFRLPVGRLLHKGTNKIEIEVTNLPANSIAQMDRENRQWRIFKEINFVDLNYKKSKYGDWQPMPSGLNGSVRLVPVRYMPEQQDLRP